MSKLKELICKMGAHLQKLGSPTKVEGFKIYAYNFDKRNKKKALSVTPLKRDLKALILELNDSDAALVDLRWKKFTISR